MKKLLNNKEDFENWKSNKSKRFILCEEDEEYPSNYPCVISELTVINCYGDKDYLHYQFIYLKDFK